MILDDSMEEMVAEKEMPESQSLSISCVNCRLHTEEMKIKGPHYVILRLGLLFYLS